MKSLLCIVYATIILCVGFQQTVYAQPNTPQEGIVIRDEIIFIQSFVGAAKTPTPDDVETFIVKTNDILCNARTNGLSESKSGAHWSAPFTKEDTTRELYLVRIQGMGAQKNKICEIKMLKKGNKVFVLKRACGTESNMLTSVQRSSDNMFATVTTNTGFKCRLTITKAGFSAIPQGSVKGFQTTIFKPHTLKKTPHKH